jgi:2-iminobutanoate/2-iminopropanoate deaminase
VLANGILFVSGQIAIDPETNQLVNSDIEREANRVMQNISAILEAAGLGFADVVKSTIFLKDMDDFAKVNHVYGTYFPENPPARETVEVARLPKDVHVEISVVAVVEG